MKISTEISEKITILRFPLIVAIVLIHNSIEGTILPSNIMLPTGFYFIQTIISQVFARLAIPIFILFSSYLLYQNYEFDRIIYRKLKNRIKTLVVPYFLWNILIVCIYLIIQQSPYINSLATGSMKLISNYELSDWFDMFLLHPVVTQFWFIRDLTILVFISPIIYWGVKYTKYLTIPLSIVLWIINPDFRLFNLNYEILFFFNIGCYIALNDFNINLYKKYIYWLLFLYLIFAVFDSYLFIYRHHFYFPLLRLIAIPGIICVWIFSGKLLKKTRLRYFLLKYSQYSFIIYALHEPLLTFIKRFILSYIPVYNNFYLASTYIFTFTFVIIFSIAIGRASKRLFPRIYNIFTGNR